MKHFKLEGDCLKQVRNSCNSSCGPSDWYKGGKCDKNGCYYEGDLPTYSLSKEMKEWCNKNPKEYYEESDFKIEYKCPACGGDGKETCNNPDHGFIEAMPGEIGRLGCPGCGHDPNHKVNRGRNVCPECGGYGHVIAEVFEEYGGENGYDKEPELVAVPNKPDEKDEQDELWGKIIKLIEDNIAWGENYIAEKYYLIKTLASKFHLSRISKND